MRSEILSHWRVDCGRLKRLGGADDYIPRTMLQISQWLNHARRSHRDRIDRVVVTGAAGYIGNILTERLLDDGYSVVGVDRLDFGDAAIRHLYSHPRFELVKGDVRDIDVVAKALRDANAVIHLASVVGDPACAANEREAVETNRDATAMLAKLSRGLGVRRMILASTCSVYGSNPDIVDERSLLNPVSLYAETKIDAERLLLDAATTDFAPTALRIGTAFGWSRRPRFDLLVNLLTARARIEGRAVIFNGDRWRPFVHVKDIARGFVAALAAPVGAMDGAVLNLGSNSGNHRLGSIADVLKRLHPEAEIAMEPTEDHRNYRVDFTRIDRMLGFRAAVSLAEGIDEIDAMMAAGKVDDYRAAQYHNVLAMGPQRSDDQSDTKDLQQLGQALAEPTIAPEVRAPIT